MKQNKINAFLHTIISNKFLVAGCFLLVFGLSFFTLYMLGLVPDELKDSSYYFDISHIAPTTVSDEVASEEKIDVPSRITIPKVGVNASVSNPVKSDADTLDQLLSQGAVRYPGSGTLSKGNMYLFGHSTGLTVVHNQAYRTFSHIQDLIVGDLVYVDSATKRYTYTVRKVTLTTADAAYVDFTVKSNMLTLSTCDVFGAKEQRYVVEADFKSSQAL